MPNCKVGGVNPKPFNFWLVQGCFCLFDAFSSCLGNRDGTELHWPGVQQVGLRDKFHMNNTDRTIFLRWVALGAMSLQVQLHPEKNMKSMEEEAKVVFFPGVAAKPSNNRAVARQLLLPQHFLTKRKSIARNCQKLLRPTATNLLRLCFLTASMLWKQKLGKFIRGPYLARILGSTARN